MGQKIDLPSAEMRRHVLCTNATKCVQPEAGPAPDIADAVRHSPGRWQGMALRVAARMRIAGPSLGDALGTRDFEGDIFAHDIAVKLSDDREVFARISRNAAEDSDGVVLPAICFSLWRVSVPDSVTDEEARQVAERVLASAFLNTSIRAMSGRDIDSPYPDDSELSHPAMAHFVRGLQRIQMLRVSPQAKAIFRGTQGLRECLAQTPDQYRDQMYRYAEPDVTDRIVELSPAARDAVMARLDAIYGDDASGDDAPSLH